VEKKNFRTPPPYRITLPKSRGILAKCGCTKYKLFVSLRSQKLDPTTFKPVAMHMKQLADIEHYMGEYKTKEVYKLMRNTCRKWQPQYTTINDKSGKILMDKVTRIKPGCDGRNVVMTCIEIRIKMKRTRLKRTRVQELIK